MVLNYCQLNFVDKKSCKCNLSTASLRHTLSPLSFFYMLSMDPIPS